MSLFAGNRRRRYGIECHAFRADHMLLGWIGRGVEKMQDQQKGKCQKCIVYMYDIALVGCYSAWMVKRRNLYSQESKRRLYDESVSTALCRSSETYPHVLELQLD